MTTKEQDRHRDPTTATVVVYYIRSNAKIPYTDPFLPVSYEGLLQNYYDKRAKKNEFNAQ